MMYSASIPILYMSGLMICLTMYWSDKVLFLRHYRIPPRHGRDLASRAISFMEYAILVHLIVGCYMLSNDTIFSYTKDNQSLAEKAAELDQDFGEVVAKSDWFTNTVSEWAAKLYNAETSRFSQYHTKLYIVGIFFFILFFILERFSIISAMFKKFCFCCCLSLEEEPAFSSNIYSELSSKDRRNEYFQKKQEQRQINFRLY